MSLTSDNIRKRDSSFSKKLKTKITNEERCKHNPYLTDRVSFHGYDHIELINSCDLSDVIFLLFRGDLPKQYEKKIFSKLCIALINPGPRHPASQASMVAGVGKTLPVHILPIALSIYGGDYDGAGNVGEMIRFYKKYMKFSPEKFVCDYLNCGEPEKYGFGSIYGDPDAYAAKLLDVFYDDPGDVVDWIMSVQRLAVQKGIGIMRSGLCAAVLCDLGFRPLQGASIMQLIAAPGLLAHGLEYSNKPLEDMLFEEDHMYEIES